MLTLLAVLALERLLNLLKDIVQGMKMGAVGRIQTGSYTNKGQRADTRMLLLRKLNLLKVKQLVTLFAE